MFEAHRAQAGTFVWRIEQFEAKPYPKEQYGKFYTGDCYIVLHSVQKASSSALEHTAYYWLGAESSQDERGAAALLTVTLDEECTGGAATQVREVGGSESASFLALFPRVQFLTGGVASGFTKVDRDAHEARLFRLKGSRIVTMSQVPLSAASLNSGDVFVLDLKDVIYQWNGRSSNRKEKAKAVDICLDLRAEEHGGQARIEVLDEGSETVAFWEGLGGEGPVGAAQPDDEGAVKAVQPKLFRCEDAAGALKVSAVPYSGALPSKALLLSGDVFIVDCGSEIFCWVGRDASAEERAVSINAVDKYLDGKGRPAVRALKVVEGAEAVAFKHKFVDFFEPPAPPSFGRDQRGSVASAPSHRSSGELAAEMVAAAAQPHTRAQDFDDGLGQAKVYRVVDFGREAVAASDFGQLYEGDSYVVHYSYEQNGREQHIVYFWQGRESSQDEKGASALLTKELDDELGGAATQVRVEQGHEPEHFLRIFRGKLVVRAGGHASGFRTAPAEDATADDGVQLYHVKGYGRTSTYGAQVDARASSLNSGDCFVLVAHDSAYMWHGSGSNGDEREVAGTIAQMLAASRPLTVAEEGTEGDAFWQLLGGKAEYARVKVPMGGEAPPRLFEVSNRTGALDVEEIFGFAQTDLLAEESYLLDTHNVLFVWIGGQANETEKAGVLGLADGYLKAAGRPKTPVVKVRAGFEPALFTAHFRGWDYDAPPAFVDPYEAKLAALQAREAAPPAEPEWAAAAKGKALATAEKPAVEALRPERASSSVGSLRDGPPGTSASGWKSALKPSPAKPSDFEHDRLMTTRPTGGFAPAGSMTLSVDALKKGGDPRVDPLAKEQYLSDADFKATFGVTKAEFAAMKAWKQAELKKKAGLF